MSGCSRGCVIVAAIVLSGCGDGSDLVIRLRAEESEIPGMLIEVRDGTRAQSLTLQDFTDNQFSTPRTRPIGVSDGGALVITVTLQDNETVVVSGTVTIQLLDDFGWVVDIDRGVSNPLPDCFGCAGGEGFPIDPAFRRGPTDSLWITWGGTPKGSDIVF